MFGAFPEDLTKLKTPVATPGVSGKDWSNEKKALDRQLSEAHMKITSLEWELKKESDPLKERSVKIYIKSVM